MKKNIFTLWITLIFLLIPFSVLAYGGGGTPIISPTTTTGSLIINDGEEIINSNIVDLKIIADNAEYMAISNTPDFKNVSWEPYSSTKQWTLLPGEGERTVYIKFKSSNGGVSSVVSKSVLLKAPTVANQPDMNNDGAINDFDFSILMSNWGTPTNTAADLNSDGTVDDFDFSILMSKWTG